MDNFVELIKSVEIKYFSKLAGFKMNLPFRAEFPKYQLTVFYLSIIIYLFAGMAELADAHGSGPCDSNIMRVQVPFPARFKPQTL